jgi:hypothetical protein
LRDIAALKKCNISNQPNRMSFKGHYHREDGEVGANFNQRVNHNIPPLRGGHGSANMGDGTRFNGWWMDTRQNGHAAKAPAPRGGFDFNDNQQPLPWNVNNERRRLHEAPIQVR